MDVSRLKNPELAQRCAEETARFFAQRLTDSRFCFELFRRACELRDGEAFNHIYEIYQRTVISWIAKDSRFSSTNEEAESFVPWIFHIFLRALQDEKFSRFKELPRVLAYLKRCTHTTVLLHLRQEEYRTKVIALGEVPDIAGSEQELTSHIHVHQLWQHIEGLLKDPRERQIAYAVFVLGYKPREIPEAYPDLVRSAGEASQLLFRARERLRSDTLLREWLASI
jgi:DNA-directed RNA polymerase specialized sigma24 family protein